MHLFRDGRVGVIIHLQHAHIRAKLKGLKRTDTGDSITVDLELDKGHAKKLICYVIDTGIGIPKKFIPHLFDQNKGHQRQGTQGEISTGMGLPLVKKFIDLHNGQIKLETEVEKGTSFKVIIPSRQ